MCFWFQLKLLVVATYIASVIPWNSLPVYSEKGQCLFNFVSRQYTEMRSITPLTGVYVHFQSDLWKIQSRLLCLWSLQSNPQCKSSLFVARSEKHSEIVFQILYWKLACPSASSYPPVLSLMTAVKMISLCSVIFRWQSWTINWVLLSSGAFTKRDV